MLCPQYSTGKHQSISTCQRQVHIEWGRWRKNSSSHCQEKDCEIDKITSRKGWWNKGFEIQFYIQFKSRIDNMTFSFKRFEGTDDDIHFYSGFQNASIYREFMTFVFCHTENMSYWSHNLHGNWHDGDEDSTQTANVRTGHNNRALSKEEELFLTLGRLHLGLSLQHIANLFKNLYIMDKSAFWLHRHNSKISFNKSDPWCNWIQDPDTFLFVKAVSNFFHSTKVPLQPKLCWVMHPQVVLCLYLSCILEGYRTRKSPNSLEFSHCLKEGTM